MRKSIVNKVAKIGHREVGKLLAKDKEDLPKDKSKEKKKEGKK